MKDVKSEIFFTEKLTAFNSFSAVFRRHKKLQITYTIVYVYKQLAAVIIDLNYRLIAHNSRMISTWCQQLLSESIQFVVEQAINLIQDKIIFTTKTPTKAKSFLTNFSNCKINISACELVLLRSNHPLARLIVESLDGVFAVTH